MKRKEKWSEYLAIQKNRTSLFPSVDKTQGVAVDWPADRLDDARAASMSEKARGTANLRQKNLSQQTISTLSQNLAPGEHVEAINTFLLNTGGVLPMKAGEEATVLQVNTTSGVDTVITTDGQQGLFPDSDLAPQLRVGRMQVGGVAGATLARESPREKSARKTPSNLHLPPQIRGNVVDAAVKDGEMTFAATLAKERQLSKMLRENKLKATQEKIQSAPEEESQKSGSSLLLKERQERADEAARAVKSESVVSAAIRSADSQYKAAKTLELERSQAAHLERQKQLRSVHARYEAETAHVKSVPVVATTPEQRPSYEVQHATAPNAKTKSAATSTRTEEESPKVSTVVKAKVVESSGVQAAVAAAEATFDNKLEKHEAKLARGVRAETQEEATKTGHAAAEDLLPEIKAAVAGAEAAFDKKIALILDKAGKHVAESARAQLLRKLAVPAAKGTQGKRAAEERRSHNAVQLGVDTAEASYTEAMAREEARSLKTHSLKNQLKIKELKVQQATMTVRHLRDALARDEDQGKHALIAKQLAQQSDYIGEGLDEEETFSSMAQKGEIAHTTQERLAKASVSMAAHPASNTAKTASVAVKSARALTLRSSRDR